jgi:hypothetical protein
MNNLLSLILGLALRVQCLPPRNLIISLHPGPPRLSSWEEVVVNLLQGKATCLWN